MEKTKIVDTPFKVVNVPFDTAIGYFPEIVVLEKQGYVIVDKYRDCKMRVTRCILNKFEKEKKDGKL